MSAAPSRSADDPTSESLRTIGLMVCMYVQLELNIRRFPRCVGGPVQEMRGELSAQQLARDMRVLRMDIDTIEAWIAVYGGR